MSRQAPYDPREGYDPRVDEYPGMVDDILVNGITKPVELSDTGGEVWDGHHRLRVAEVHGLPVPWVKREY